MFSSTFFIFIFFWCVYFINFQFSIFFFFLLFFLFKPTFTIVSVLYQILFILTFIFPIVFYLYPKPLVQLYIYICFYSLFVPHHFLKYFTICFWQIHNRSKSISLTIFHETSQHKVFHQFMLHCKPRTAPPPLWNPRNASEFSFPKIL